MLTIITSDSNTHARIIYSAPEYRCWAIALTRRYRGSVVIDATGECPDKGYVYVNAPHPRNVMS